MRACRASLSCQLPARSRHCSRLCTMKALEIARSRPPMPNPRLNRGHQEQPSMPCLHRRSPPSDSPHLLSWRTPADRAIPRSSQQLRQELSGKYKTFALPFPVQGWADRVEPVLLVRGLVPPRRKPCQRINCRAHPQPDKIFPARRCRIIRTRHDVSLRHREIFCRLFRYLRSRRICHRRCSPHSLCAYHSSRTLPPLCRRARSYTACRPYPFQHIDSLPYPTPATIHIFRRS